MPISKRFVSSPPINVLIVSGVLGFGILLLYVVSPTPEKLYVSWGAISASNWLRFGADLLLSVFLPGFFVFDVLNARSRESPVRYFLFSYLLSVFIVTFANLVVFLVSGSWMPLNVLILTNCGLFGIWLVTKRGKIGCSRVSCKLVLTIAGLVLFFLGVSLIHRFFIYGDQFDYHGWVLSWAETPFRSLNGVIEPFYPWWTYSYLSTLFKTTGLPSVNTYVPLIVLNMMPVVAFFCLVRTKADARVSIIATFLAFFTSGFGWIYLPLINAGSQVDTLQQLGWKTYDVTVPNSFLSITPDLSTSLLLIGLPSLLAVLAIAIDEKQTSSQRRYYLLTAALTALTFLSHTEAGAILVGIYALLILTNRIKNTRLQLSFLSGLLLVSVIDLLAPAQYYTVIAVSLANNHIPLLLVGIAAVSLSIILGLIFRTHAFNSFSTFCVRKTMNLFSKLRSMDFTVVLSFCIERGNLWKDNPPSKRLKFSLIALSIALLVILSYLGTFALYSVYFFPAFHFNVSSIPWYIYPVRLGMVGALALGFLLGCIFFQWHKKEKLPYALTIIGIPLVIFLGYYGFYQQHRLMKYIPLLMAPFAAVFLTRLADCFSLKIHSKIHSRVIQVATLVLILSLSTPSMILYFQYEALCQDPAHYPTLARRIPISNYVASAAEFLLDNSNFSDTIATFPLGYGGSYSYVGQLTGRDTTSFLPIFAIKQAVDFFKVASDIQLKYAYVSTVEEGLINKYCKDGFLNFYTSIASIAHETDETKIYVIPRLFPPSENPECSVLDLSAFARSPSSKNSSFLSYLLLGLSGIQYALYSYPFTGLSPKIDTIVMPLDPDITFIDRYLDWVNNGGKLVVLASDQLGSFSTFLGLNITGIGEANSIRNADIAISIPNIQFPLISSKDPDVTIQAYYTQDQQLKSPFFAERNLGNGTIKYLYLAPLFSHLLSSGNGSADTLAQITPTIINMLGFKANISSTNTNHNFPNYVLEKPTYSGNLTCTTDYLTFNAPEISIKQSDSIEQHFKEASVAITGSLNFAINNSSGSISAGTPQGQEIAPTIIYDDGEFWTTYLGPGTGTVGKVSIVQDVSTVRSGNSSTKITIEPGSRQNSGVYHNFGTTDWSSAKRISVYVYGSGTNAKISLALFSGPETGDDVCIWEIADNFTEWKKLTFDFSSPTRIGSNFNITDIKKMYAWFDTPGTWYVDRFALDVSGPTQTMPFITFQNNSPKDMDLVLSKGTLLVITSENQAIQITAAENQEISLKAAPNDIYLDSFDTNLAIDGAVTFKGSYGYWLEQTPAVHDIIKISGLTSFKPAFAELITYVYAEDGNRDFVVKYNSNPIIYISDLHITGKYTHSDEK